MVRSLTLCCVFLLLIASAVQAQEKPELYSFDGVYGYYYDSDLDQWLQDSDLDGTTDLAEHIGGTDPNDPSEYPGSEAGVETQSAGFPTTSCRSGFRQAGSRLCINTTTQNATRYDYASAYCRAQRAHLCTYEDLFYLYLYSTLDATYNPYGVWIGNLPDNDDAYCGDKQITYNNDSDMFNFEGHCARSSSKPYWCCHDLE